MGLSRTPFQITDNICIIFLPPVHLMAQLKEFPLEICNGGGRRHGVADSKILGPFHRCYLVLRRPSVLIVVGGDREEAPT